jgi:hypothetical protein
MNTVDSLSTDEREKALNRRRPGHVVYDAIIGTGASRRMKNHMRQADTWWSVGGFGRRLLMSI